MGRNKLPAFKPVKRLQRDKRYSNAQQLSPDDSVSQYDGEREQYAQQDGVVHPNHYTPEQLGQEHQYAAQHDGTRDQYPGQDSQRGQRVPGHAPIAERKPMPEHSGHMHGQTMSKLRKWLLIISMLLLLISIVFIILVSPSQLSRQYVPANLFHRSSSPKPSPPSSQRPTS